MAHLNSCFLLEQQVAGVHQESFSLNLKNVIGLVYHLNFISNLVMVRVKTLWSLAPFAVQSLSFHLQLESSTPEKSQEVAC